MITHCKRTPVLVFGAVQWTMAKVFNSLLVWVPVVWPLQFMIRPFASPAAIVPIGLLGAATVLGWIMNPLNWNKPVLSIRMVIVSPGLILVLEITICTWGDPLWGEFGPWFGDMVKHAAVGAPSGKVNARSAKTINDKSKKIFFMPIESKNWKILPTTNRQLTFYQAIWAFRARH